MSRPTVIKSFTELPQLLGLADFPTDLPDEDGVGPPAPVPDGETPLDPTRLLADLQAASATLATVARQDQETRALALRDLDHYDALVAAQREAERAHERAQQVRLEAEALAAGAFAEEARAAAGRVAGLAAQAEATAACLVEQRRREAERLAAHLDLERLLAERRRAEEAEKARVAEAERARRLSGALAEAQAALQAGRLEEAQAVLGPVTSENPDSAELASLTDIIAQRALAVKAGVADEALWLVRREYRHHPAEAVARLEALDVDGLPALLASQVFGEWARACARLCRERDLAEPLRYAPDPGRGAVIARQVPGGRYVVVSALGMGPGWQAGNVVDERQVRRARPLR